MIQEVLETRVDNKDLTISEVEVIPGENTLAIIAEVCKNLESEGYDPTQENLFVVGTGLMMFLAEVSRGQLMLLTTLLWCRSAVCGCLL